MATVRAQLSDYAGDGSTFALLLYPRASGVIANGAGGDALAEETNGCFAATVAEALVGTHRADITRNGVVVYQGWVNMSAASPVVDDPAVPEFSPGALEQLTGLGIRLFSRQPRPGKAVIVQYDEWSASSQLLRFEDEAGTSWPEMPAETPVVLRIEVWGVRIEAAGVLVNGEGVNKEITVALPRTESGKLPRATETDDASKRVYQLLRDPETDQEWLLDEGVVTVTKKIAAPEDDA
jgi:hypothetical protein